MNIKKLFLFYFILVATLFITAKLYAGHGAMQSHQPLEIAPLLKQDNKSKAPKIMLLVEEDPEAGWNVNIKTKNFAFAPQNAGLENHFGEGHVHLYVDDYKFARVYGNWFHIPNLRPGKHIIKATLNANDHSPLMLEGKLIESSVEIQQSAIVKK